MTTAGQSKTNINPALEARLLKYENVHVVRNSSIPIAM
jgi:hypothetical protein